MVKRVLEPCSIIRMQTWDGAAVVPPAVEQVLGAGWPASTGTVAHGRGDVICVGPTDWLVIAPDPGAASWLRQLDGAFDESPFRSTDVSQALVRIEIGGTEVRELLAKGCALDLHPSKFAPGQTARTRFAGMPVIVHCTAASKFECIVTRSYADYLLAWFDDAAVEFSGVS
jgi:sarcosine oxidase subunit gamma